MRSIHRNGKETLLKGFGLSLASVRLRASHKSSEKQNHGQVKPVIFFRLKEAKVRRRECSGVRWE